MLFNKTSAESVMAGGHRRMRREYNLARDMGKCLLKGDALLFHTAANRFEHCKSAMPFVQMQNARRDPHRLERAKSADAQQQFLPDPHAPIAAIQARSELAVFRSVPIHV